MYSINFVVPMKITSVAVIIFSWCQVIEFSIEFQGSISSRRLI